jgi:hypothetical protein
VGPARMIVESLTPRPGIREQNRPNANIEGPAQASYAVFYACPKFGSIPCRLAADWGRIEWLRKPRRTLGRKPGFSSPIRVRIWPSRIEIEAALKARGRRRRRCHRSRAGGLDVCVSKWGCDTRILQPTWGIAVATEEARLRWFDSPGRLSEAVQGASGLIEMLALEGVDSLMQ